MASRGTLQSTASQLQDALNDAVSLRQGIDEHVASSHASGGAVNKDLSKLVLQQEQLRAKTDALRARLQRMGVSAASSSGSSSSPGLSSPHSSSGKDTETKQAVGSPASSSSSSMPPVPMKQGPSTSSQYYHLVRDLKKTILGKAFRATHISTHQPVAIKVSSVERMPRFREDPRQEIMYMQELHHPNLVRLLDYFECELCSYPDPATGKLLCWRPVDPKAEMLGYCTDHWQSTVDEDESEMLNSDGEEHDKGRYLWVVTEWYDGGDLLSLCMRKGSIPEADAWFYFQQLCAGVDFMHSKGVCHLDLSPENIMLANRPTGGASPVLSPAGSSSSGDTSSSSGSAAASSGTSAPRNAQNLYQFEAGQFYQRTWPPPPTGTDDAKDPASPQAPSAAPSSASAAPSSASAAPSSASAAPSSASAAPSSASAAPSSASAAPSSASAAPSSASAAPSSASAAPSSCSSASSSSSSGSSSVVSSASLSKPAAHSALPPSCIPEEQRDALGLRQHNEPQTFVIIDFGLSVTMPPASQPFPSGGHRAGKRFYRAPEHYFLQPYEGRMADVYSLGVILFVMLTGRPAYAKPNPRDASYKYATHHRVVALLKAWRKSHAIPALNSEALHLLEAMLCQNTACRTNIDEIASHVWSQHCLQCTAAKCHRKAANLCAKWLCDECCLRGPACEARRAHKPVAMSLCQLRARQKQSTAS